MALHSFGQYAIHSDSSCPGQDDRWAAFHINGASQERGEWRGGRGGEMGWEDKEERLWRLWGATAGAVDAVANVVTGVVGVD